jgi:hypothetical protein
VSISIQTAAVAALIVAQSAILVRQYIRLRQLRSRFSTILDADAEAQRLKEDAARETEELKSAAAADCRRLRKEAEALKAQRDTLTGEVTGLKEAQNRLAREVSTLEENLEDISFGVYKPHFAYDTPDAYKAALETAIDKQRAMIRADLATHCAVQWTVGGSRKDGERMQRQYGKLLLRAFNGESEAAIAKVAWNNAGTMEERIRKAFVAVNSLGSVMHVAIGQAYLDLKVSELYLEHEFEEKKRATLEEQRRVREEMKEQERERRELETAAEHAEEEEARFTQVLEKARLAAAQAEGEEHARLTKRVLELEGLLNEARKKKERVKALAELTKAGYVYVLSNIGSFGENVYKIGMTRRLDPMDRVRELGSASVPFRFDVHAMVYGEDAVTMENAFHQHFAHRNVNFVNMKKEFFRVSLDEVQTFAAERGFKMAFTRLPEAREFRETLANRRLIQAGARHFERDEQRTNAVEAAHA